MKYLITIIFLILLVSCKQEMTPTKTIQEDVTFLADDKLEGRQTGTEGEKAAADYIAERFKNLGISPKGTNGYFQTFSFIFSPLGTGLPSIHYMHMIRHSWTPPLDKPRLD